MLEVHPFGDFVPKRTNYLLIGSFTTKEAYDDDKKAEYVWFYSNGGRNYFWPMLEHIYNVELKTRSQMQKLLTKLGLAMVDIILSCERNKQSNLDVHLTNITYNVDGIENIINSYPIKTIYFTSRFVEEKFKKVFKDLIVQHPVTMVTLPSPSPRYVLITKAQKLQKYQEALPNKAGR